MPRGASLFLIATLLVAARATHAVDGVIEINQARALAGGVTPGDDPGFPVTLSQPGSYRLTGNLDSPIATGAILITSTMVTLDLNGFAVRSTNVCTGYPTTSCHVQSGDPGILANVDSFLVTVRNGTVYAMGGNCLQLGGASSEVDQVRALGCGGNGIYVSSAGRVTRSFSGDNLYDGIQLANGGSAESNEARANGGGGVVFGGSGLAFGNRVLSNASF